MESRDGTQPDPVQTKEPSEQNAQPVKAKEGSSTKDGDTTKDSGFFKWSGLAVAGLSALVGILGTPYGIYVAAAVAVLGALGFFLGKSAFDDWKFKNLEKQAGAKAGTEASDNSTKVNENRDEIDDFLGRERRS